MRTFALLAVISAGVLAEPLSPSAPAAAQAATCQGQPATLEATGGDVVGTPGPDVIVVSGSLTRVDAGDGDDVICVVGNTGKVTISAGGLSFYDG